MYRSFVKIWNKKKLYKIHGEKINAALEMFEYKIEENTDDKLVSVYKVKETVDSIIRVFICMLWTRLLIGRCYEGATE